VVSINSNVRILFFSENVQPRMNAKYIDLFALISVHSRLVSLRPCRVAESAVRNPGLLV
jgi:hypothetical protein